jgi:NAD(P)-dependent dehydrogenase (short-subunit alcohol dehydrogenase family)
VAEQVWRVNRDPEGVHPAAGMMTGTPAGRMGTPDEIAAAIVFLCSDDSGFIHGSVLDVDGGPTAVAVLARAGGDR